MSSGKIIPQIILLSVSIHGPSTTAESNLVVSSSTATLL